MLTWVLICCPSYCAVYQSITEIAYLSNVLNLCISLSWWRHQMETFSRNSSVSGGFPVQRPVTPSFDIFFYLHMNERLSKQSGGWWFETPSHPLWRRSTDTKYNKGRVIYLIYITMLESNHITNTVSGLCQIALLIILDVTKSILCYKVRNYFIELIPPLPSTTHTPRNIF